MEQITAVKNEKPRTQGRVDREVNGKSNTLTSKNLFKVASELEDWALGI